MRIGDESPGYLHRDVSIGNVLKLKQPAECKPFTTRGVKRWLGDRVKHIADSDVNFWTSLLDAVGDDTYLDLVKAAERLEKALEKLGVSTTCMAVLIDADMAASLSDYFSQEAHHGVISVSPNLLSVRVVLTPAYRARQSSCHAS